MIALIGRDDELAAIRRALEADHRCVVVGTGGIGKSSLARAVADEWRGAGRAVAWIDLEPLDGAEGVAAATARALNADVLPDETSSDAAARAVSELRDLLVLDGVEHVADGVAALLATWQTPAAVLVTSRAALPGVTPTVRVAPLTVPPDAPLSGTAGRLLIELVVAHGGREDDPAALADVVVATGGLPLAVELAARQIARFGAAFAGRGGALQLAEHVVDRSVDRSIGYLSSDAALVFRALGHTAGAAQVAMVATLAATERRATLTALGELVDHGLVFMVGDRFDLLPPIRDRAARLAADEGDLPAVIERAALAAVGDGRDEPGSAQVLDEHVGTFLHLAWLAVRRVAATDDAPFASATTRYLNSLYSPLSARMEVRELIALYRALFDALDTAGRALPPELEAHAARYAGMAASEGTTLEAAERWLDRAERTAGRLDRPDLLLGRIGSIRAALAIEAGELGRAEREATRAMAASGTAGDPYFVEQSRWLLAEAALQRGDLDRAEQLVGEVLAWGRAHSSNHEHVGLTMLGWTLVERGDRAAVAALARTLTDRLADHPGYNAQVAVEALLLALVVEPGRLDETPPWDGDATWWLRLEQRVRRAGALPIDEHWEHVVHTAADVMVLADTVPIVQPRLSAGLLLGDAALAGGDVLQARIAYGQVLRDGVRRGYRLRVADALDGIAVLAGRSGHDELASQTAELAQQVRDRCGARPWVRPSLPEPWPHRRPVPAGWIDGGGGPDVTAAAADQIERALVRRAPSAVDATLTRAERKVARLVADGMTNAEIAEVLVVSRRTVESHLVRVYRKLGVRNRTQLARLGLGDP